MTCKSFTTKRALCLIQAHNERPIVLKPGSLNPEVRVKHNLFKRNYNRYILKKVDSSVALIDLPDFPYTTYF